MKGRENEEKRESQEKKKQREKKKKRKNLNGLRAIPHFLKKK